MAQQDTEGLPELPDDIHSWVLVKTEPVPSSPSSDSSQASLVSSAEFMSPEVLEPMLDRLGPFLATRADATDPRREQIERLDFKSIGLFVGTCKTVRAHRSALVRSALGCAGRDALGVSFVLRQHWSTESRVHEAGCESLVKMMPHVQQLQSEALDDAEDECLRIGSWEHGILSIVHTMRVCIFDFCV